MSSYLNFLTPENTSAAIETEFIHLYCSIRDMSADLGETHLHIRVKCMLKKMCVLHEMYVTLICRSLNFTSYKRSIDLHYLNLGIQVFGIIGQQTTVLFILIRAAQNCRPNIRLFGERLGKLITRVNSS